VPYAFDRAMSDRDELLTSCMSSMSSELTKSRCGYRVSGAGFADAMLRTRAGDLRVCPESWDTPEAARQGYVHCSALSQCCRLSTFGVSRSAGAGGGVASLRTATS